MVVPLHGECGIIVAHDFTFFENVGTRAAPKFGAGRKLTAADGKKLAMDLQMITPSAVNWDGDGWLDIICGDEDGRLAFIRGPLEKGMPVFEKPYYFRQEADCVKFGALSMPFACDWYGDGDWDVIADNSAGYLAFIENLSGSGVAKPRWAEPKLLSVGGVTIRIQAGANGSIQGPCEAKWGYTVPMVADWDVDGKLDIAINDRNAFLYKQLGLRPEGVWRFRNEWLMGEKRLQGHTNCPT